MFFLLICVQVAWGWGYRPTRIAFMACRSRASLGAEGFDGVDSGGAARRQIAGQERGSDEAGGNGGVSQRVRGIDFEQQWGHEPHDDDGDDESAGDTDAAQEQTVANEHASVIGQLLADGHPNADLTRALRYRI